MGSVLAFLLFLLLFSAKRCLLYGTPVPQAIAPALHRWGHVQGRSDASRVRGYAKLQRRRGSAVCPRVHVAAMYSRAMQDVESGKGLALGQIYLCSVCGATGDGEPPNSAASTAPPRTGFVRLSPRVGSSSREVVIAQFKGICQEGWWDVGNSHIGL